jgi:hypothetical protein
MSVDYQNNEPFQDRSTIMPFGLMLHHHATHWVIILMIIIMPQNRGNIMPLGQDIS